jgi:hypothetical protein
MHDWPIRVEFCLPPPSAFGRFLSVPTGRYIGSFAVLRDRQQLAASRHSSMVTNTPPHTTAAAIVLERQAKANTISSPRPATAAPAREIAG